MSALKDWFEKEKIEAVIFDLDNTLIDRQSAMRRYCTELVNRYCPESSPSQVDALLSKDDFGYAPRDAWCNWMVRTIPSIELTSEEFYRRFLDDFPKFFTPSGTTNQLLQEIQLLLPTAIATNGGSSTQRKKLELSGIAQIIEDIFISEEISSWKPDHAIFHAAIGCVGVSPKRVLLVGDDPIRDIAPAIELGLRTCWIAWNRKWTDKHPEPEFTVRTIQDFRKLATS